ncbi:MAG: hypothetical protein D6807_08955 [Alphaproteobacteria bacterium]|nr:MAG: hypothetical protein D6807_08955 [Alphaproteobacteria bacterium]
MAAASGAILVLLVGYVWRAHRRPVQAGPERLTGATGEIIDWQQGEGHVWIMGERWNARGPATALAIGTPVRVIGHEGLVLTVAPLDGKTREDHPCSVSI